MASYVFVVRDGHSPSGLAMTSCIRFLQSILSLENFLVVASHLAGGTFHLEKRILLFLGWPVAMLNSIIGSLRKDAR